MKQDLSTTGKRCGETLEIYAAYFLSKLPGESLFFQNFRQATNEKYSAPLNAQNQCQSLAYQLMSSAADCLL